MTLIPVNDNIIVKLPKIEETEMKTKSGIILGKVNTEAIKQDRGTIVAVGEGRYAANGDIIPLRVKENQEIIFNRFAGSEIIVEDEKYLIIKETDILAIIK